jgi:hypothetical protein
MSRALMCLVLLSSCATAPRLQQVHVRTPDYYFVVDTRTTQAQLQAAVDAALAGDDTQLSYVISLARFADGEGALNFGFLLLDLEHAIGTSRFQRVLITVSQKVRQHATAQMRAAARMHDHLEHAPPTA